ncbi:predicted protein, partial [Nematostella vectensis]
PEPDPPVDSARARTSEPYPRGQRPNHIPPWIAPKPVPQWTELEKDPPPTWTAAEQDPPRPEQIPPWTSQEPDPPVDKRKIPRGQLQSQIPPVGSATARNPHGQRQSKIPP